MVDVNKTKDRIEIAQRRITRERPFQLPLSLRTALAELERAGIQVEYTPEFPDAVREFDRLSRFIDGEGRARHDARQGQLYATLEDAAFRQKIRQELETIDAVNLNIDIIIKPAVPPPPSDVGGFDAHIVRLRMQADGTTHCFEYCGRYPDSGNTTLPIIPRKPYICPTLGLKVLSDKAPSRMRVAFDAECITAATIVNTLKNNFAAEIANTPPYMITPVLEKN